jgi:hypothetical protein
VDGRRAVDRCFVERGVASGPEKLTVGSNAISMLSDTTFSGSGIVFLFRLWPGKSYRTAVIDAPEMRDGKPQEGLPYPKGNSPIGSLAVLASGRSFVTLGAYRCYAHVPYG